MKLPPTDFELLGKAVGYAARVHRDEKRDDGTPYVAHPFRMCLTLMHQFRIDDAPTLAATLLHDVIEHAGINYDEIHGEFGEEVADLVAAMTKNLRLARPDREAEFAERLLKGSWKLKAIKLADAYDNLADGKSGALLEAERALACAGNESPLKVAVESLRELKEKCRRIRGENPSSPRAAERTASPSNRRARH